VQPAGRGSRQGPYQDHEQERIQGERGVIQDVPLGNEAEQMLVDEIEPRSPVAQAHQECRDVMARKTIPPRRRRSRRRTCRSRVRMAKPPSVNTGNTRPIRPLSGWRAPWPRRRRRGRRRAAASSRLRSSPQAAAASNAVKQHIGKNDSAEDEVAEAGARISPPASPAWRPQRSDRSRR